MKKQTIACFLLLPLAAPLFGCPPSPEEDPVDPCAAQVESTWDGSTLGAVVEGCASVELTARTLGGGAWEVSLSQNADGAWVPALTASGGDATFEGLVLEGSWTTAGDGDAVLWRQGYQSWSWSGVMALEALTLDDETGLPVVGGDGDALTVVDEEPGTSWWAGLVGRDGGGSLLLGAQGATKTRFWTAFDDGGRAWAVWGGRGDAIEVTAGETLTLDPLWLGVASDAFALHRRYADAVTSRVGARTLDVDPITGWATWYYHFEDVTEEHVRANFAPAAALGLEVFQIYDGWQQVWGDWTADDGFPSGMAQLASDIAGEGFVAGLWLAPLYVDRSTTTYAENPSWWVRGRDGEELSFSNLNTGDYAVLDVTHPDAAAWLHDVIAGLRADGWDYFKFDFLYAGAQVGRRHEANVTGVEAYHRALTILREAAGDDAWLLACGAPFLPSVGYADSYRTGADIAFGFDRRPQLGYLRWQGRATAARSWTNDRWWWIDADQILVREPFTDDEATGAVVANAVSGGVWMLGDDLPVLDPARADLAMTDAAVALRGLTPRPHAPLAAVSGLDGGPVLELAVPDDAVPTTWTFPDGTVALLNLSELPVVVDGPGGTELLSGATAEAGSRTLAAGAGELWRP